MRKALVDTDVLSEVLKRKDAPLLARAVAYTQQHGEFTLSAATVHEIVYGLRSRPAPRQLAEAERAFAQNTVVLPVLADYERAATIRGEAQRRGVQIALADSLIGATAERLGLPVATGNTRHFEAMVEAGLRIELENWRQG